MRKIKVSAPATVANVCCGFDVLGLCVEAPSDEVVLTLRDSPGIVLTSIQGDGGLLSTEPEKNTAGVAIRSLLSQLNSTQGVEIDLTKKLPLGSGMGSSAASAVAAVVGMNHLLGNPFSRRELVVHAMEAERIACGAAHADNVAPCLMGGFVLIRGYQPLDVVHIPYQAELWCTLIHPHIELKTSDSRKALKATVSLKDAVAQSGNIAALMIGLMQADYDLISRSLHDVIAEPVRSAFIPGFNELKQKALGAGALGFGISGSGPTVFALSRDKNTGEKVGEVAQEHFGTFDLPSTIFNSRINREGAKVG